MAFGGDRYFKKLKDANAYVKRAQEKGYFVSKPKKQWDGRYWVSTLTKKGRNPFFMKGL